MARVSPQPKHSRPKIALERHSEVPLSQASTGSNRKIKPRLKIAKEPMRAKSGLRLLLDEWISICVSVRACNNEDEIN